MAFLQVGRRNDRLSNFTLGNLSLFDILHAALFALSPSGIYVLVMQTVVM